MLEMASAAASLARLSNSAMSLDLQAIPFVNMNNTMRIVFHTFFVTIDCLLSISIFPSSLILTVDLIDQFLFSFGERVSV